MFNAGFFTYQSIRQCAHFSLEPIKQQTLSLMQKFNMPTRYSETFANAFSLSNKAPRALQQAIDIQHCDNMITGLKLFLYQQKQLNPAVYQSPLQRLTEVRDNYIATHVNKNSLQHLLQLHHENSLEKKDVSWEPNPTEQRIVCGMSRSLYDLISLLAQLCPHESFMDFYIEQYHLYLEMVATPQIPTADIRVLGITLYNDIYAVLRQTHSEIFTHKNNPFLQKLRAIDSEYHIFLRAISSKRHFLMFYLAFPKENEMLYSNQWSPCQRS